MPARIALDLRRYEQFADAAGWTTQADEAQALGVSESTVNRIRNGAIAPGERFIARLLAIAVPRNWDFHDLFTLLDEDGRPIPLAPAEPAQSVA